MELLESLIVNKKNFIILASIYVIIVIAILVWIWWPEKTYEVGTYEPYNESAVNSKMLEYYVNFLTSMKNYASEEAYQYYVDSSYLKYTGLTIQDIMNMLGSTDNMYVLDNYAIYDNDGKKIYSVLLPNDDEKLQVNIIEKTFPYNFYITFDTFVKYSDLSYCGSIRGAEVKIIDTYQTLSYIEYKLSVTNNEHDTLILDMTSADNFELELEDGSTATLNMINVLQDKVVVEKSQTEVVKLRFDVGIEKQNNIKELNISKISNGSLAYTTTIMF